MTTSRRQIGCGTYIEAPTVVPKALFLCVEELSDKTYAFASDRWEARMPNTHEADLLDLTPGTAVMHLIHPEPASVGIRRATPITQDRVLAPECVYRWTTAAHAPLH